MKNTTISVGFDEEKLAAARIYLAQKNLSVEEELGKALEALYQKYVPGNVREFIEMRSRQERSQKKRAVKERVQEACSEGDNSEYGEP